MYLVFRSFRFFLCYLLVSAATSWQANSANAAPFAEVGDLALRHDIKVLADAGVISAPVSTWPIAWNSIAIDIKDPKITKTTPRTVINSLRRVQRHLQKESRKGRFNFSTRLAVRSSDEENIPDIRKFANPVRENAELSYGVDWMGKSTAFKLQATYADDPIDNKEYRLDGSYFGVVSGGWSYILGLQDRWWGPGMDGGLIMTNSARPVPAFSIQRIHARPFETKWLSWLGPWQFQFFLGQLESDRHIPQAKLMGARFNFKPFSFLELGLSRTAQFGGEGRPENLETLKNLILGRDNRGQNVSVEEEPGNQLGGADLRISAGNYLPIAMYFETIGEDEINKRPFLRMELMGIETWGQIGQKDFRLHVEFADTHCADNSKSCSLPSAYNVMYNHAIYQTGYRYRGLVIGHSMDNDSKMRSVGINLLNQDGSYWELLLRDAELNTDGAGQNIVSSTAQEYTDIILSHRMNLSYGQLGLEIKTIKIKGVASGEETRDSQFAFEWIARF